MENQVVTIQSQQFSVPRPYAAGHVLTEVEASVLNQTYAENIRNNFAQRIKTAAEKNEPLPTQADLDTYCASYSFGVRAAGKAVSYDPVAKEARNLIRAAILQRLKAKKIDPKSLGDGELEKLIEQARAAHPQYTERAQEIVNARRAALDAAVLES